MKRIFQVAAVAGFVLAAAAPVFAASHEMDPEKLTCGEMMAMDGDGQMKAMEAMKMVAMDADMDGDVSNDDAATDATATTENDELSADEEMIAMKGACEGHPDMMAMDAMMMKG